MRRYSSRAMAVGLALVLVIALLAVLAPVTAQASGWGPNHGPRMGHQMHNGGSAYFNPNHLPRVVVRDDDYKTEWWGYELRGGHYVRFYCPQRFGDGEHDYTPSVRPLVAGPVWTGPVN
jgi:hypothetical protein